jgi:DNA replication protein DnaC
MSTSSPYEQLKDDLGYLALGRAAERFAVLAEQAQKESWSHVDYLSAVMADQVAATTNRRLVARMRYARFPFRRTVEDFDFEFQPSVDRKLVADLASLRFISENRAVLFLGQPGCGKTHLAVALAIAAVEAGYRGYFSSADDMAHALVQARREGTFAARLRAYTAPTVLVLDDLGLLPVPPGGAAEIFHVINTRYERGHPTLVTTNRGLPEWGGVFGDPVVAGAILDRLMHRAIVFNIKGPSWRMKEHHALATASKTTDDDSDDDPKTNGGRRR